ncbi:hypothetical protein [[Mycoplasma] collis]|uniref:hypothetical protein n=1 Tax=[Mycoplasma] collis TaxID=2127 RepID=UPI000A7AF947|nr:hypothetical protein [[Mycoplasma] collis]
MNLIKLFKLKKRTNNIFSIILISIVLIIGLILTAVALYGVGIILNSIFTGQFL